MSVRTVHFSPEVTRPMAMPPIICLIGTPASMSASVDPQVEAIDDEPFDSSVSLTTRIVYGNSSFVGSTGRSARSASAPWPISRLPAREYRRTVRARQDPDLDRELADVLGPAAVRTEVLLGNGFAELFLEKLL